MLHFILRAICRFILNLFFGMEKCGRENVPKNGGFILASNHVSYLDPVAVGSACPRKLNYMARHDLFSNPFSSWLLTKVGSFPVKKDAADIWALREAVRRVKNGEGLLLFPEGRRLNLGEEGSKIEAGVGFLADKLNVPVIPVHVNGTEKAWPKGAKFITPKKVTVIFGKQIDVERGKPYQDIAESIMENIRHLSC